MLDVLPRCDQRAKGELYVRGLLTDGPRKSMQPMAERLGVDHQQLQQFITSSTWDYERVRRTLPAGRSKRSTRTPTWSMTPGSPRTAVRRRAWPASTPARWARPATAKSEGCGSSEGARG